MKISPLGLNDLTCLPPPCLTHELAEEFYHTAFLRVCHYAHHSKIPGDILEFGTSNGYTARVFAETMHRLFIQNKHLWLYDSWEGFPTLTGNDESCPEAITGAWKKADLHEQIPHSEKIIKHYLSLILGKDRIHTIRGFYDQTLQIKENLPPKAAIVHIDCDLHTSTKTVLDTIIANDMLSQGSVILCDDFNNNFASYNYGERKALQESELNLELWFTYGASGYAFIVHKN